MLPRPVGPEAPWTMVAPALVTAGCSIAVALGAGLAFSPLSMARVIVEEGWWP